MTLRGHTGTVHAVAFDRSKIISAGDDGTLRTWEWGTKGPKQVNRTRACGREGLRRSGWGHVALTTFIIVGGIDEGQV